METDSRPHLLQFSLRAFMVWIALAAVLFALQRGRSFNGLFGEVAGLLLLVLATACILAMRKPPRTFHKDFALLVGITTSVAAAIAISDESGLGYWIGGLLNPIFNLFLIMFGIIYAFTTAEHDPNFKLGRAVLIAVAYPIASTAFVVCAAFLGHPRMC